MNNVLCFKTSAAMPDNSTTVSCIVCSLLGCRPIYTSCTKADPCHWKHKPMWRTGHILSGTQVGKITQDKMPNPEQTSLGWFQHLRSVGCFRYVGVVAPSASCVCGAEKQNVRPRYISDCPIYHHVKEEMRGLQFWLTLPSVGCLKRRSGQKPMNDVQTIV